MAAASKGLAPDQRETLFKTLQGLIQNGDVPIEDFNTLVAELNQQTNPNLKDVAAAFHDSHLSDMFGAAEFGDFAAEDGDDLFAGEFQDNSEWPSESENPFPDDFLAAEADSDDLGSAFGFEDHVEEKTRQKKTGHRRGRSSGNGGEGAVLNSRGRSRNTRSKQGSKKDVEDILSNEWEAFGVDESSFDPVSTSKPTIRGNSDNATGKKPSSLRKTEATKEGARATHVAAKDVAESQRRRTSSSHRKKSDESNPDPRTPTKTREKRRSLSRKKKEGEKSSREENGKRNLDAVLTHMLNSTADKDNLTTSGDTATTSSETKATISEEAHKKSPRKKVLKKKVAAGIRADDVSTILKAIESGMIEANSSGKILIRMGKQKTILEDGQKGTSLSRVLDSQKLINGSTENRSISSAPVQATERLPGAGPPSQALRRRSRSRKSRSDEIEEEVRGSERSKSQGRRRDLAV